jgi:shikimate dehydrogenase
MIRLGLVGFPLGHSLSPALHHAALNASNLQGEYALYPVEPAATQVLHSLIDQVRGGEIQGLNVTIPHKQTIIRLLDELTPAARAIGAVNTIFLEQGKAVGDNTDFAGFRLDLLQQQQPIPGSTLVLGAGGAARAVVYALSTMGCQVSVAARRVARARELARQFPNASAMALTTENLKRQKADLLVNATSAGMFPSVDECAWPLGLALPGQAAVYDLVYSPPETRLMREARMAGLRAINGLGMLIEQAALAFELWTGRVVPRSSLAEAIGQTAG